MSKSSGLRQYLQFLRSRAPQMGFFSTLDELIEQAPFPKAPADQWASYLRPGRTLEQEGLQFPLKKSEVAETQLLELLQKLEELGPIPKETLSHALQRGRPDLRLDRRVDPIERRWPRNGVKDPISEGPGGLTPEEVDELRKAAASYEHRGDIIRYGEPDYSNAFPGGYNLSHFTPGSLYEENITTLKGLREQNHFKPDTLSWSRTSVHNSPEYDQIRLVEEIQSDIHQQGRKSGYDSPEHQALQNTLPEIYLTRDEGSSYYFLWEPNSGGGINRTPRVIYGSGESLEEATEKARMLASLRSGDTNPGEIPLFEGEAAKEINRINQHLPPADVPFKDPKEYAKLELSKQLLNAVNNGESYLALVRGKDQIDRYFRGATPQMRKGMEHMYDELYPSVLKKLAKQYGAEITEVSLDLKTRSEPRLDVMQDIGAENINEFFARSQDMFQNQDPETAFDTYWQAIGELKALLPDEKYQQALRRATGKLNMIDRDDLSEEFLQTSRAQELFEEATSTLREVMADYFSSQGEEIVKHKTFPALEITPEVAERVKKAGVALYSTALGSTLIPAEDDKPQGYAKGGKVEKAIRSPALQRAFDYLYAKPPREGMFSTLSSLIDEAPFDKNSAEQWLSYLHPGRPLVREGIQFPLKKSELEESQLLYNLKYFPPDMAIEKNKLLNLLATTRPTLGSDVRVEGGVSPLGLKSYDPLKGILGPLPEEERALLSSEMGKNRLKPPGITRYDTPVYGNNYDTRLSHESPNSTYEEDITTLRGLTQPGHFEPDTLSWARTSSHQTEQGPVRLVEEIQSDVHQRARETGYETRETLEAREELPQHYITQARANHENPLSEYFKYAFWGPAERQGALSNRVVELTDRDPDKLRERIRQAYPGIDLDQIPQFDPEESSRVKRISRYLPPDVPFKDPKEYAKLELSKQLLNAIDSREKYLALVRGKDQVARYSEGLTEDDARGMEYMYDVIYPSVLKKLAKQIGAEMTEVSIPVTQSGDTRLESLSGLGIETPEELSGEILDAFDEAVKGGDEFSAEYGLDIAYDVLNDLGNQPDADVSRINEVRGGLNHLMRGVNSPAELARDLYSAADEDLIARFEELMGGLENLVRDHWERSSKSARVTNKTFPALKITPEVAERVKKSGLPIFSTALGSSLIPEEDRESYAKGGKVVKGMKELAKEHLAEARAALRAANELNDLQGVSSALESLRRAQKEFLDASVDEIRSQPIKKAKGGKVKSTLMDLRNRYFGSEENLSTPDVEKGKELSVMEEGFPAKLNPSMSRRDFLQKGRDALVGNLFSPNKLLTDYLTNKLLNSALNAGPLLDLDKPEMRMELLSELSDTVSKLIPWAWGQPTLTLGSALETLSNAEMIGNLALKGTNLEGMFQGLRKDLDALSESHDPSEFLADIIGGRGEGLVAERDLFLDSLDILHSQLNSKISPEDTAAYASLNRGSLADNLADELLSTENPEEMMRILGTDSTEQAQKIIEQFFDGSPKTLRSQFWANPRVQELDDQIRKRRLESLRSTTDEDLEAIKQLEAQRLQEIIDSFGKSRDMAKGGKVVNAAERFAKHAGKYKNPDISVPPGYARFESRRAGKNSAHIIGVTEDGREVQISTATPELAEALASAYNAGGYTDLPLEKIPLGPRTQDPDVLTDQEIFTLQRLQADVRDGIINKEEFKQRVNTLLHGDTTDRNIDRGFAVGELRKQLDAGLIDFKTYKEKLGEIMLKNPEDFAEGGPVSLKSLKEAVGTSGSLLSLLTENPLNLLINPEEAAGRSAKSGKMTALALKGFLSQWLTLDEEEKKAVIGTYPGLIDELIAIPAIAADVASLFGGEWTPPEASREAAERAEDLWEAISSGMDLSEPQGVLEHAAESLGIMGAQVPVPSSKFKRLGERVKELPRVGKGLYYGSAPLRSAVEWFSPIVEPKASAYGLGTAFGTSMGLLGEEPPDERDLLAKAMEGDQDSLVRLNQLLQSSLEETPSMAKGGKVKSGLMQLRERYFGPEQNEIPNSSVDNALENLMNKPITRREVLEGTRDSALSQLTSPSDFLTQYLTNKLTSSVLDPNQSVVPKQLELDSDVIDTWFLLRPGLSEELGLYPSEGRGISYFLSEITPEFRRMMADEGTEVLPEGKIKYDPDRFKNVSEISDQIIEEYEGDLNGELWDKFGLFGDDDVDYHGGYIGTFREAVNAFLNSEDQRVRPDLLDLVKQARLLEEQSYRLKEGSPELRETLQVLDQVQNEIERLAELYAGD